MDFDETMARYHQAANAFAEGDPEPIKALLSDRDDIMLANPFGPAVFGREKVAEALEYAASRFREGEVTAFEAIAKYVTIDLASSMSWSGGAPRLLAETRRPSSTCASRVPSAAKATPGSLFIGTPTPSPRLIQTVR